MRPTRWPLLFFSLAMLTACGRDARADLGVKEWKEDLHYLASQLAKKHVAPFEHIGAEEFKRQVSDLESRLTSLSSPAVIIELSRLVATIGDGHTELNPFQEGSGFHRLPIVLYFFNGEPWINGATEEYIDLIGSRVTRIGDVPIEQCLESIKKLVARDNDQEVLHSGVEYLVTPEILQHLGFASGVESVTFSLEDSESKVRQVEIPAFPRSQLGSVVWKRGRKKSAAGSPVSAKNRDRNYWFEHLPESSALYVAYNRCQNESGGPSIKKFARDLVAAAEAQKVSRVVLDLRTNSGGDNNANAPLVDQLVKSGYLDRPGGLYVIVGRTTFSAAVDLIAKLQARGQILLVGEAPRGRPNTVGDRETLRLPRSGLSFDYSTRRYERFPELGSAALLPLDIPVSYSFADYEGGVDPFLEAVVSDPPRTPEQPGN